MGKSLKKCISLALTAVLLLFVCACGKYISSYKAIGLIKTQTLHGFETSFSSLDGQLVFKVKKTKKGTEGAIDCFIQVEKGELWVYYDIFGVKEELAHVKAGESVDEKRGYVEGGYSVYVIIEATEGTKGKVCIELDN